MPATESLVMKEKSEGKWRWREPEAEQKHRETDVYIQCASKREHGTVVKVCQLLLLPNVTQNSRRRSILTPADPSSDGKLMVSRSRGSDKHKQGVD